MSTTPPRVASGDATDAVARRTDSFSFQSSKGNLGNVLMSGYVYKLGSGIGILFDDGGEKPAAVVVVSADLVKKELNAGKLAKEIGSFMGGGGGGKPHLATAGGKDSNAIDNAMKKTEELIKNTLA